jgi:hypothetical protein
MAQAPCQHQLAGQTPKSPTNFLENFPGSPPCSRAHLRFLSRRLRQKLQRSRASFLVSPERSPLCHKSGRKSPTGSHKIKFSCTHSFFNFQFSFYKSYKQIYFYCETLYCRIHYYDIMTDPSNMSEASLSFWTLHLMSVDIHFLQAER